MARVGVVYDERMCGHEAGERHPENPDRIRVIWKKLISNNIIPRCIIVNAREAVEHELLQVHSKTHLKLITTISSKSLSQINSTASKLNSIYLNKSSSLCASLSAGSVLHLCQQVSSGSLHSGFAIVRPPGHHAEPNRPMGFCLFNNVAVAASSLLSLHNKILIVDWDVHHGNATQKMFYNDPRVLFFSVHRHDHATFYPANDDGSHTMLGSGPGLGFNVNVPWDNARCSDSDYLAAWDHVLIPLARSFDPDFVIVSAGFDAALGDPLGGCCVTPNGYALMLRKLMQFAHGKIVLALEGGYNLDSIADCALACMQVLLGDHEETTTSSSSSSPSHHKYPFDSSWRVIEAVRKELSPFWPALAEKLPEELTRHFTPYVPSLSSDSDEEASDHVEDDGIIEFLSKLKLTRKASNSETWRPELSKTDIWYASFGSNMWHPRFMCYIEGGQVEGMLKPCTGSQDKTPPKDITWKSFPNRLFFAREFTASWGQGGVAFIDPEPNVQHKTYMCLYRITLEQFNDVVLQENTKTGDISSPLLDLVALNSITTGESNSVVVDLERGWYRNVVYLGNEDDTPILTITCSDSDMKGFKSGEYPVRGPSERYAKTLTRGLVHGKQFSESEAVAYIRNASSTPL